MDKLQSKDIERMITFINHEAEEKIKEIELRATQEYNNEKAKYIKEESDKMNKEIVEAFKQVETEKMKKESFMINKYNLMFMKEKERILEDIYKEVLEKCKREKVSKKLVEQCVECIDGPYLAYCQKGEKEEVKGLLGIEDVRDMCEEGVGGIVICSEDGKTVVDNSYASRLEVIKMKYSSEINKEVFIKK